MVAGDAARVSRWTFGALPSMMMMEFVLYCGAVVGRAFPLLLISATWFWQCSFGARCWWFETERIRQHAANAPVVREFTSVTERLVLSAESNFGTPRLDNGILWEIHSVLEKATVSPREKWPRDNHCKQSDEALRDWRDGGQRSSCIYMGKSMIIKVPIFSSMIIVDTSVASSSVSKTCRASTCVV